MAHVKKPWMGGPPLFWAVSEPIYTRQPQKPTNNVSAANVADSLLTNRRVREERNREMLMSSRDVRLDTTHDALEHAATLLEKKPRKRRPKADESRPASSALIYLNSVPRSSTSLRLYSQDDVHAQRPGHRPMTARDSLQHRTGTDGDEISGSLTARLRDTPRWDPALLLGIPSQLVGDKTPRSRPKAPTKPQQRIGSAPPARSKPNLHLDLSFIEQKPHETPQIPSVMITGDDLPSARLKRAASRTGRTSVAKKQGQILTVSSAAAMAAYERTAGILHDGKIKLPKVQPAPTPAPVKAKKKMPKSRPRDESPPTHREPAAPLWFWKAICALDIARFSEATTSIDGPLMCLPASIAAKVDQAHTEAVSRRVPKRQLKFDSEILSGALRRAAMSAGEGIVQYLGGLMYEKQRQMKAATSQYRRFLDTCARTSNREGLACARNHVGCCLSIIAVLALQTEEDGRAGTLLTEAADLHASHGHATASSPDHCFIASLNLALVYRIAGQPKDALLHYRAALSLIDRLQGTLLVRPLCNAKKCATWQVLKTCSNGIVSDVRELVSKLVEITEETQ